MKYVVLAAISLLTTSAHAAIDLTCVDATTQEQVLIRARELGGFSGLGESTLGIPDSLSVIRVNDNNKDDLSMFISSIQPSMGQTVFSGQRVLSSARQKIDVAIDLDNFCGIKMIGHTATITVTDSDGKQSITPLTDCGLTPKKQAP
jgi:hypothetical protein